jgi:hypothetical protein
LSIASFWQHKADYQHIRFDGGNWTLRGLAENDADDRMQI